MAITPAAGFVSYGPSIFIGIVAALISNVAVQRFQKSAKIGASLDVFACHGLGGIIGMLLTALFCARRRPAYYRQFCFAAVAPKRFGASVSLLRGGRLFSFKAYPFHHPANGN